MRFQPICSSKKNMGGCLTSSTQVKLNETNSDLTNEQEANFTFHKESRQNPSDLKQYQRKIFEAVTDSIDGIDDCKKTTVQRCHPKVSQ